MDAFQRGNEAFVEENFDEALACYTEALKAQPSNVTKVLEARAHTYLKLGKYLEAAQDCNAAISRDPSSSKALMRKG